MNDDKDTEFVDLLKYSEMERENAVMRGLLQRASSEINFDDAHADALNAIDTFLAGTKQTGKVLVNMATMSKIYYLIGYAQSASDMTPTVRTWFDILCEEANDLRATIEEERCLT